MFVVTTGDTDDVALELVAERVDGDFLGHSLFVEDADLSFIVDVDLSRG